MFSSGWRKTEPLDLKRGRGALPEEEGFRKSLCSVILQSVNESPYNELRVPSTWWKGALDLPGSSGSAAGCSQTWGRTGSFVFILHLKPPGAFWFECGQTPSRVRGFSPQFPPPYRKHTEEGALELIRNQGQSPREYNWCQIKSQVDMVVVFTVHISGCPQYEKCCLFSSPTDSPSSLWALPDNEKQRTDIYLKCVL